MHGLRQARRNVAAARGGVSYVGRRTEQLNAFPDGKPNPLSCPISDLISA
jgi:hypothetical protein